MLLKPIIKYIQNKINLLMIIKINKYSDKANYILILKKFKVIKLNTFNRKLNGYNRYWYILKN